MRNVACARARKKNSAVVIVSFVTTFAYPYLVLGVLSCNRQRSKDFELPVRVV